MLRAYARHAVLESLHAGSGKECGKLRCSAAKRALSDPQYDMLVISIQQDTLEDWGKYLRRICRLPLCVFQTYVFLSFWSQCSKSTIWRCDNHTHNKCMSTVTFAH